MPTQRALVHKSRVELARAPYIATVTDLYKGVFEVRNDVPLPRPRDDYIIVATKAVALNPTDYKSVNNRPAPGAIAGCDYAGVVEQVGRNVYRRLNLGDRVAGFVRGGNRSLFWESTT